MVLLRDRRLLGYKFRRQHPVGKYFADFACAETRLIIELDGSQHIDNEYDAQRTRFMHAKGWRVVRIWDDDILLTPNEVLESILLHLSACPSAPPLSPLVGRGES